MTPTGTSWWSRKANRPLAVVFLTGMLCICTPPASAQPQRLGDPISDWNSLALDAIRGATTPPTLAARNLALLHGAMFDAVNGITRDYQSYRYHIPPPADALPEAAASGAAHETLTRLYPERRATFDAQLTSSIATLAPGSARDTGLLYGRAAAQAVLAWRANDQSSTTVPYLVQTNAGHWQRTPPHYRPPDAPNWPLVTPFAMTNGAQFRPPGPPPLDSERYARDVNQVQELGALHSRTRTPEQTEIARFWSDFSYTDTPPGHWNRIALDICKRKQLALSQSARLFALLNFALADAGIVAWDAKYVSNFWRPVTAIRQADRDGNPATAPDPDWQPLFVTPPFPEYISGHSIFSATAAQVLAGVLGTDAVDFSITSDTLPGVVRAYHGLRECAEEIGMSRIYGGIHFLSADLDGLAAGRALGDYVVKNFLPPVKKSTLAFDTANQRPDAKEAR